MERSAEPGLLDAAQMLPAATPLLERLRSVSGEPVYLVGGAVRDLLLGRVPSELDLAVEGDPEELAAALGGSVRAHDRFGTRTVELGGARYDIARTRRETYAAPGALPDVAAAPIEEDLARRDFTVNTLALALSGRSAGELLAVTGARTDLQERVLRVIHERSFIDDPTRLFRLARYAARLGFQVEPATRALAQAAIESGATSTVSATRIGNELRLLAREHDAVRALADAAELGLGPSIAPGFQAPEPGRAARALSLLPGDGRADLAVLALAFADVDAGRLPARLTELGFTAADHAVIAAGQRVGELSERLAKARAPSEIAGAAAGAGPELIAIAGASGAPEQAKAWLERLREVRLEIDGSDLRAAGIPEGPAIGAGLAAALAAKLDGAIEGRDDELAAALAAT
ncbi:MAG: tRNA nucleotidyltransferase/poly(A) polymerase family protein [Solirubrobacteraceae bacterium]